MTTYTIIMKIELENYWPETKESLTNSRISDESKMQLFSCTLQASQLIEAINNPSSTRLSSGYPSDVRPDIQDKPSTIQLGIRWISNCPSERHPSAGRPVDIQTDVN